MTPNSDFEWTNRRLIIRYFINSVNGNIGELVGTLDIRQHRKQFCFCLFCFLFCFVLTLFLILSFCVFLRFKEDAGRVFLSFFFISFSLMKTDVCKIFKEHDFEYSLNIILSISLKHVQNVL